MLSTLAPGKVNLALFVGAPRADGLHPIVSVVQPVALADEVTLEFAGTEDSVVCPGVDGENLALRALREFRSDTGWTGPPVRLTITKRIPIAAGMAGGSSDAAAALRLAAEASGFAIPPGLPMRLGADVPVMLAGVRALVTGAGERVEPMGHERPSLVILPVDAQLGAGEVYAAFDRLCTPRTGAELAAIEQRFRDGMGQYLNDLAAPARALCPAIEPAIDALHAVGVRHPTVTGSGPTVFGWSQEPAEAVARLHAAGHPRAVVA